MTTLKIKRDKGWADKVRSYKIVLDGKVIENIKEGESKELNIDAGQHELFCKIDWSRSNKVQFDINNNESKDFKIQSSLRGFKAILAIVYYIFLPHKYSYNFRIVYL